MDEKTQRYYYRLADHSLDWGSPESKKDIGFILNKVSSGGVVLEIGCGTATILDQLPSPVDYIGIDAADFALEEARKRYGHRKAIFLKAEPFKLPRPDNSIDVVLGIHVLEHLPHPRESLKEIIRVLKPGGLAILIGPNFDLPWGIPNAFRHHGVMDRIIFRLLRLKDYFLRIFGILSFRMVKPNYTEYTGNYDLPDDDLRYVLSSDEVIKFIKSLGSRVIYTEGIRKKSWKSIVVHLPGLHYYGRGLHVVFQK